MPAWDNWERIDHAPLPNTTERVRRRESEGYSRAQLAKELSASVRAIEIWESLDDPVSALRHDKNYRVSESYLAFLEWVAYKDETHKKALEASDRDRALQELIDERAQVVAARRTEFADAAVESGHAVEVPQS